MSKLWIGIDPGVDGAIAVFTATGLRLYDMPSAQSGKGRRIDPLALAGILAKYGQANCDVAIELVHAFPGQGVSSCFSFGHSLGVIEGVVASIGLPYELVSPVRWRKVMMADFAKAETPKERKAQSVLAASRLYPAYAEQFRGPKGGIEDGRADATLLAAYLARARGGAAVTPSGSMAAL